MCFGAIHKHGLFCANVRGGAPVITDLDVSPYTADGVGAVEGIEGCKDGLSLSSLPPSLPHSLTPSLPPSLTHSLHAECTPVITDLDISPYTAGGVSTEEAEDLWRHWVCDIHK